MDVTCLSTLCEAQRKIVEKILLGESLSETLTTICKYLVSFLATPSAIASICILEEGKLRNGSGPHIPELCSEASDNWIKFIIDAASLQRKVIVRDIENDPLWADNKEYVSFNNLKVHWIIPIISLESKAIGSLSIYYPHAIKPSNEDITLIELFSCLSGLAIEKHQFHESNRCLTAKLLNSNEKFLAFLRVIPDLSLIVDENGIFVDYYGSELLLFDSPESYIGKHIRDILSAEKFQQINKVIEQVLHFNNLQTFKYKTSKEYSSTYDESELKGIRDYEVRAVPINNYLLESPDIQHILLQFRDITQSNKVVDELQEKDNRLSLATSSNGIGIWDWNLETQERVWDDTMLDLYQITREEFSASPTAWEASVHFEDLGRVKSELEDALQNADFFKSEYRVCWPNGEVRHIKAMAKVFRDAAEKPLRMLGTNFDISEIRNSHEKLKLAADVFITSAQSICITDENGIIVEVNNSFSQINGYSREEVLGKTPRILHSGYHSPYFYKTMWKSILKKGQWTGEIWNRNKDGDVYPGKLTISRVRDQNRTINYVGYISDLSQEKADKNQLEHMVYYDTLTNLPNRRLLIDRLSQMLSSSQQEPCSLAVVCLDIDNFKKINNGFGYEVGDQMLVILAKRIKKILREGEMLARIAANEFVILLIDFNIIDDYSLMIEKIQDVISSPVTIDGCSRALYVSASMGISSYSQADVDAELLIRQSYQAMYKAKQRGKNCYCIFDSAQDVAIQSQLSNLQRIRTALEQNEFVLYYQPKVDMRAGEVIGVEALIRWVHPTEGILLPNDFLHLIDNHVLSLELDEWVINRALEQMNEWQVLGLNILVSVNISAQQLQQKNFVSCLKGFFDIYSNISPEYLQLEVLETSELTDVTNATKVMKECIELGVSFALDDFGTGYSSLTYLRQFPAQLVKIDQSFVRNMLEDPDDLAIVKGVVGLTKSFKRSVLAEGVETIEHGTKLLKLGCQLAQGNGIAQPMPAQELPHWIDNWRPDERWKIIK